MILTVEKCETFHQKKWSKNVVLCLLSMNRPTNIEFVIHRFSTYCSSLSKEKREKEEKLAQQLPYEVRLCGSTYPVGSGGPISMNEWINHCLKKLWRNKKENSWSVRFLIEISNELIERIFSRGTYHKNRSSVTLIWLIKRRKEFHLNRTLGDECIFYRWRQMTNNDWGNKIDKRRNDVLNDSKIFLCQWKVFRDESIDVWSNSKKKNDVIGQKDRWLFMLSIFFVDLISRERKQIFHLLFSPPHQHQRLVSHLRIVDEEKMKRTLSVIKLLPKSFSMIIVPTLTTMSNFGFVIFYLTFMPIE